MCPPGSHHRSIRHVLMTADPLGGVWSFALELSRVLARRGLEISLVTMGAPLPAAARTAASAIPNLRVIESGFKLEWMEDPWADVERAGDWLMELRARLDPDVVHMNHLAHGDLPLNAPVVVTGHSCALSWWQAVHGTDAPSSWDPYRRRVRESLQAADVVTSPTETMLASLRRRYGPFRETRVIYHARLATEYRGFRPEPVVLASGRVWDRAKNHEALARIARRLPWPVMIAGDPNGPSGPAVLPNGADLIGRLPPRALARLMSRAAIYAAPAWYEPFGLATLEAALSGCALVLGDIDNQREIWNDAAVFVPPGDDDALHGALRSFIRDRRRREDYAHRARARAESFHPEVMADGYLHTYAAAIAAASSSSLVSSTAAGPGVS